MTTQNTFDVIIVGGSYSGLAAGMALGRSLRKVLIIDSGLPCNRQTPHSHNFLTHDGDTPTAIAAAAKKQVSAYETVAFISDIAVSGKQTANGFEINTASGKTYTGRKLLFATGIKDIHPDIPGFSECWGISVLHCPYCHGYEVRNKKTGILGNGDNGYEMAMLISNWTKELTLYTDGPATLTKEQQNKLHQHQIPVAETKIKAIHHDNGQIQQLLLENGTHRLMEVLYSRRPFTQTCTIPELLGCELNSDGYLKIDGQQKTTVKGVYASGDNVTRVRTVANAVSMGTTAGMMVNKELIEETF